MADFVTAYNWMMDNEDSQRKFNEAPDPCPKGVAGPCFAIGGVNSGAWPQEYAAIKAADQAQRQALVQDFYQKHYWNQWYAQLGSDEVCKRVFDFAVNGGATSVRCLQQAVNSLVGAAEAMAAGAVAGAVSEDGGWGPKTVAAANAADAAALVTEFKAKRLAFYQDLAAADPSKQQYLKGWTARAGK